jgi:hypothetical protein
MNVAPVNRDELLMQDLILKLPSSKGVGAHVDDRLKLIQKTRSKDARWLEPSE